MRQEKPIDLSLAEECAKAFHAVCGIGCTVSDRDGVVHAEYGYGYPSCRLCALAGSNADLCTQVHTYGMTEAERFGGKYIYTCPMGLNSFVSPIFGGHEAEAKITVGPFLMVDRQDYVTCELTSMSELTLLAFTEVAAELEHIPSVDPRTVTDMSNLLFLAVGYMNNISAANRMLDVQEAVSIQSSVSEYVHQMKQTDEAPPYPLDTEYALMQAIKQVDLPRAKELLNELLGHILFTYSDVSSAKTRIYELLVLMNRTAISSGGDADRLLEANERYFAELSVINNYDTLCSWLTRVMNAVMDRVFGGEKQSHAAAMQQTVRYIRSNFRQHLTLEELAGRVYLSPAYFSRIFREEMGEPFTVYLNRVRVEHSMGLLRHTTMKLADIAAQAGFNDQSYFTRTFKKFAGMSPMEYRKSG